MSFRSREWSIGRAFGPFVDPPLDEDDFFLGQPRRLSRHRRQVPLSRDRLKQEALGGLARHDGRPAIAALVDERKPIQPQPRLRLARPVALEAMLSKERLDLRGKVDRSIGGKERGHPEHGQQARRGESANQATSSLAPKQRENASMSFYVNAAGKEAASTAIRGGTR